MRRVALLLVSCATLGLGTASAHAQSPVPPLPVPIPGALPSQIPLPPAAAGLVPLPAGTPMPAGPTFGGFNSVLGVGEGQTVNAADLAQYEATNVPPASFTNQEPQYSGIDQAAFSFAPSDFGRYYKNSSFGVLPGGLGTSESPEAGLTILRDKQFSVPRIYGQTRAEVMFGAGYATGEDRLFFMDVLRHMSEGSLTDLLGPSAAPGDSAELGQQDFTPAQYTQQIDDLGQSGPEGSRALADIRNYIDGINVYINAAKSNPTKMPAEYAALGTTPATWTEADTAAVAIFLIGQFTVSGGGQPADAQILSLLQERHPAQAIAMYNDFRRLNDPQTPLVADRNFPVDDPGPINPAAVATLDAGSVTPRNAVVSSSSTGAAARAASASRLPAWAQHLANGGLRLPPRESNALLVDARHSADGHPLAAMGPQVGYYSPEIFDEYELHGPGIDVSGVTFPGAAPYPLIGHGIDFAWTGTTANGGNEDVFAERLCNADGSPASFASTSYEYRGQCIPFDTRTMTNTPPVSPTGPAVSSPVTLKAMRSVHGPLESYATVHGAPVALTVANATQFHAPQSAIAFMELAENQAHDAASFIDVMHRFIGNENWFYTDDRDIGWFESGWFPLHATGSSRDLPIWGTGPYDWKGFDPASYSFARLPDATLPAEINPPEGYLVSWNNKEVPNWPAPAGTWSFGPAERAQELSLPLKSLLATHPKVDLAQITQVSGQAATKDLRGQVVLPLLLKVLGSSTDPRVAPLLDVLNQWERDGAQRVDLGPGNVNNDSAALLLFDAWWPRLVQAIFQPALGADVFSAISKQVNPYNERPNDSGFFNGWQSYVDRDLSDLLGAGGALGVPPLPAVVPAPASKPLARRPVHHKARRPVHRPAHRRAPVGAPKKARRHVPRRGPLRHLRRHRPRVARTTHLPSPATGGFSQVYCGAGSLGACRGLLLSTLLDAEAQVAASQGPDLSRWQDLALCPVPATGQPTCDEEVPITAGAVATPPFPFQNRGTFHQAVEVTGHRPR